MSSDEIMNKILLEMLEALEDLAKRHTELYDTETRGQMLAAICAGFVKPRPNVPVPSTFVMFSDEGDNAVCKILNKYISVAKQRAEEIGLEHPSDRLAAFYGEVETDEGRAVDDFFGWIEAIE